MKDPYKDIKKKLSKSKELIYFDIETSPMSVYIWSLGQQYVTHSQIIQESKVISIQWMFEGDKKVSYLTWDKHQDDAKMLEKFSRIMLDVKTAVTQNGKEFDHKVLRWRLNLHKLTPLRDVEILDTLKLSRASFRAPSHKLDYRSKKYGLGGKIPMDLRDWINVVNNIPGALEKMIKYGCKDVPDLRSLFWRELPYYKTLPVSLAQLVYPNDPKAKEYCARCASARQSRYDVYPTKVGSKNMMKCNKCGNLWKDTKRSK